MGGVFDDVKSRVTIEEAARLYGLRPNRSGFVCCPFHGEKSPSLRLYAADNHFHCYGCGAGGSVIDLVAMLFNLTPIEAVRKLDADFHLGLPLDKPMTKEEREAAEARQQITEARQLFAAWREETLTMLCAAHRVAHLADLDNLTDAEVLAVRFKEALSFWADTLSHGKLSEQIQIFRDRKEVESLCRTILNSTPTRSEVA